jgi:tRNA dimethylallyltransferase
VSSIRWIGLAGPTASGKSAASLALAQALPMPVEIVSVDSAQVYRGMDIGTAKPTPAERDRVPHHLIDILDPRDAYSAAQFVADATRLVDGIRGRNALPLLVGGTMLYFKSLLEGLHQMPAAHAQIRAALDAEAALRGWPALHAELAELDPVTAARLAPNDAQRIQRALEVFRATGRPLSSFHGARPIRAAAPATPLITLEPRSRAWLHERIERRFDAMLAAGFVDEVARLQARGDLHLGLPSMRSVGYRQVWMALEAGEFTPPVAAGWASMREAGIAATRQLAKRQLTWLRAMPSRHAIACDEPDAAGEVVVLARRLLG